MSFLAVVALLGIAAQCRAQVSPTDEYRKLVTAGQGITPLGAHPFGESVNLYNGSLSFAVTDVSIPGTGPTLSLTRSLDTADTGFHWQLNRERPFGDWDLDIPRIETDTAQQANVTGWFVASYGNAGYLDRCTNFVAPPPVNNQQGAPPWGASQWWHGYNLIIPGEGSQVLLAGGPVAPRPTNGTWPIDTQQNWQVGCGVVASDGGEGFVALAPDGTRYTFTHLVYRPEQTLTKPLDEPPGIAGAQGVHPMVANTDILSRREGFMYVTKVEDRFGNTLTYNWSSNDPDDPVNNHLTSIIANDGREIDFSYTSATPLIHTVTVKAAGGASARTWTYSYDISGVEPRLTGVQLPDGSAWSYQLGSFQTTMLETTLSDCTNDAPYGVGGTASGSMTAPSGLTATFTLTSMAHGRSYVPEQCIGLPSKDFYYPAIPNEYAQFSLTKEVLTGPGISTGTWTYNYSSPNQSWTSDSCATSKNCATTVYTDVIDPLAQDVRYTYSNRFDASEGKLLHTDTYSGAAGSTDLRSVVNNYANPTGGPWSASYGDTLQAYQNHAQLEEISPLLASIITQDSATFTTHVNTFDDLARPISTTESSSLGYSKADTTAYQDDTSLWVLGLVTQTATNSIANSQTTYTSLDLPYQLYVFGKLISTEAWNSNGTLASTTDGDSNTTTFSTWYRGVPGKIIYADSTSQSATVNGNGWITSVTDENGYTTNYGYDAMGRLASLTYPSGDDVAWNPTSRVFEQINSSEYNIPAGHWRLTETTGNGTKQTFYDAFWRPLVIKIWDSANFGGTVTKTITRYDADGRLNFQSYPDANVSDYTATIPGTHTSYDALDRVITVQKDSELGTLTTTTQYLSGFQTIVTDPRGYATTTGYQAYNEPTTQWPASISAPQGELTVIVRDAFGKPLSLARTGTAQGSPQVTRSYVYDSNQQLCKRLEPETGATAFGYDGAGNTIWSAGGLNLPNTGSCDASTAYSSGVRVDRTYDKRNRIASMSFPDGNGNQTWTYTPDGLPSTIGRQNNNGSNELVTNSYLYDKRRLMISEALTEAGWYTWTIGYGHDANGHLASEVYPNGLAVSFAPNALGQPTQVGGYATGASYAPDNSLAQFTYGNGIVHSLSENTRGLPSALTDTGGGVTPVAQTYTYDADGDLTALSDAGNSAQSRTMSYDGLDRLAGMNSSYMGGQFNYSYDVLDNLVTLVHVGGSTNTYTYDTNNRLTVITNPSYPTINLTWDAMGNVASKGSQTYGFDYDNRMRWATGRESYRYDGLGRRILAWSALDSQDILSMYTEAGQLAYQQDARASVSHAYLYLGGQMVAVVDYPFAGGSSVRYMHVDKQGTVVAQTNASRTIMPRSVYDSWGNPRDHNNDDGPGYTGHLQDSLTALTYMQQRYYDPSLSRFLSADPVGVDAATGASFNRYWYANDNPYRYTDPFGEQSVGEMIDSAAQGCGAVSCAGYAMLNAAWELAGAEPLSQLADKGWSGTSTGEKIGAVVAVVAVLPVGRAAEGVADAAKAAEGVADAAKGASAARTAFGRSIESLKGTLTSSKGPWKQVSAHFERATSKTYQGGTSIEQVFVNKTTGQRIVRHTIVRDDKLIHETYRPYTKSGSS